MMTEQALVLPIRADVARDAIVEAMARNLVDEDAADFLIDALGLPPLVREYVVTVTLTRTYNAELEVEASSEKEAEALATARLWHSDIVLDAGNFEDQRIVATRTELLR